ncbi:MAG: hypothetical protein PHY77_02680 [Desulfotomaculaceae bacterium]|nr:hypothetical protein [Desulfotomaculaceae bacterium]
MEGGSAFMVIPIIVIYVFIAVVAWRFMRAHESIAESARIIAENLKKGLQER